MADGVRPGRAQPLLHRRAADGAGALRRGARRSQARARLRHADRSAIRARRRLGGDRSRAPLSRTVRPGRGGAHPRSPGVSALEFSVHRPWLASALGHSYALAGRVSKGLSMLQGAVDEAERLGNVGGHAWRLAALGEALLLAGRPEEADKRADQALRQSRQRGERGHEAWALRLQAETAASGNLPRAMSLASGIRRRSPWRGGSRCARSKLDVTSAWPPFITQRAGERRRGWPGSVRSKCFAAWAWNSGSPRPRRSESSLAKATVPRTSSAHAFASPPAPRLPCA